MSYRIERRIANTDQWRVIDHAETKAEAIAKAGLGDRPAYAGVRIVADGDPDAEPEMIHGTA